ncbi:MAG UNVERIFIED_CONTAM: hypothetical protein LVT10_04795 [Anaerolineae bacterium]|jgi:uncharacterized protein YyaL (SSP411 family)
MSWLLSPLTDGGLYDTSHDHEALIVRPRTLQDSAVPSGNTMIAKQLLRLHAFTGDHRYREPAEKVLLTLLNPMQEFSYCLRSGVERRRFAGEWCA